MSYFVYFDSETYSECEIKKSGSYRYAAHPTTEWIMLQYAVGDAEVVIVDKYDYHSESFAYLQRLAADPEAIFVFWNAPFDRNVLRYTAGIDIPIERCLDAMVLAISVSLPGSLAQCGAAMQIEMQKLKGKDPINVFCKPAPKNRKVRRYTPEHYPELWQQFREYGARDVEALREIFLKLPRTNFRATERNLWMLDTKINERGVRVDKDLIDAVLIAIEKEKARLNNRVFEITGGDVGAASQRDALKDYLNEHYGLGLENLQAGTVEEALKQDLDGDARELLEIRQQISKTSTSKYQSMLAAMDPNDWRLRGMLQFNGASRTGRYAGRLVQLQNLPRPKIKPKDVPEAIARVKEVAGGY